MIHTPMSLSFLRGLVRRCLAVLFTVFLGGVVFSAPAIAQQGSRDVVGVTLGMTPEEVEICWRHLNSDPPCRSNIDPGRIAEFGISNCG